MTASGIFLHYHGQIDFPVIDELLNSLKKTKEFSDLEIKTRKRTYSIVAECMENICKYSALQTMDKAIVRPHITVRNEKTEIIISAGNPVSEKLRYKLGQTIDNINSQGEAELRKMHEAGISNELPEGQNGTGIGFISMAFKSGNKIKYCFSPLISGYLYFEMLISVNK
jgi:hypothetical protein